ncbi:MAG TPA: beta-galactosidase GalA [Sphingomonas sp.]|uniref:beta-galactosidase GalA n=1 Tax=Sphingomonas sp. TaxID=28214 RepID=UPI002C00E9AC|nr:beta-galactosidase GalA [Sphingomonas sp.]HMI19943.1 beta-galactosidase GalA [Sphingomonas sp.]
MTTLNRRETFALTAGAALLAAGKAVAATPDTPSPRERLLLDRGWRFHLGHAGDPERDFQFGRDQRTFAKAGVTSPATLAAYDDKDWAEVRVPHDWATDLPYAQPATPLPADRADAAAAHGFKAIGRDFPQNSVGWYRLTLPIDAADKDRRVRIEFDGVFRDARIFVNGYQVAENASGYAPFGVDITDFLNPDAPNQLALRVDASLGEGWFYEGAGIYRNVWLVKTGPVHVPQWGIFVHSEVDAGGALIRIEAEATSAQDERAPVTLYHRLIGPSGTMVAEAATPLVTVAGHATGTGVAEARIAAPQLWSIETPNLYRCVTDVLVGGTVVDRVETKFGIRTIRFDAERGFFLNGKPVKLLGTCNHQDHAGVGTAIPDRLNAWRVEQLQAMGSNAWRSAHNPPSQALLDICDAKGMLMIDEARINSTSAEGMDELTRLVRRDRNHPCIILWSVGNEEPHQGSPRGARISAEMRRHILTLDPTRPITQAIDNGFGTGASRVIDVIGFNYRTDQIPAYHAKFPDQPIIGTETASTVATRGAYANDPATHVIRAYDTEHPWWATTAEEWWKIADAHPYIAGGFIWTGFDYRGEPTPYPQWPSVSSAFGVLDLCGFPKDNFYYYRAWWRPAEPQVHLLPHWTWPGREGQPIEVWAYANCDEVELLVNGRSAGRRPMERSGHIAWSVPYAPGRIEAIAYSKGRRVARDRRETTGPAAAIVLSADRLRIAADGRDLAMLTARIVDRAGRTVPDAADSVTIALGNGLRLLGTGNGDPTCTIPDHVPTRPAFHGLMQAIVQSDGQIGPLRVSAAASGLRGDAVTLLGLPS